MTIVEQSLFRQEVLEARRVRIQGEVLLTRPLRAHAIIALLAMSVFGFGTWITLGQYTRMEPTRGILMTDSGATKIIALRPGVITQLMVSDGKFVRKGQVLATVQVDQNYANGGRASEEGLSAIQVQRQLALQQVVIARERAGGERAALMATIAGDRQQLSEVEAQFSIQEQVITSLQESLDRVSPVAERGFISRVDIDRRGQELMVARQESIRLKQQLTSLQSDLAKAQGQLRQSQAEEHAQAATARSSSESLRVQESQLHGAQAYVLQAPSDGVVTALQASVGRTVDATFPLLTIVPKNAFVHAELYAPSRAIGFVKPGQEVRLQYDAFPYERFGTFKGRVQMVSRVVLDPREIAAPLKVEEAVYRVNVIPDRQTVGAFGDQIHLQPGMALSGNIVLERRSFLGWLLEPLRAVINRTTDP